MRTTYLSFVTTPVAGVSLVTVMFVALSSAAPGAVTFSFQRTPNGERLRYELQVRTTANSTFTQSSQVISDEQQDIIKHQVRDLRVIESDPAKTPEVEVTYVKATTRHASRWFSRSERQAVADKTYRVARVKGTLRVTYPDGSDPPSKEVVLVQSDMQAVGRSNPLAQFLNGRTVEIGQQLELPEHLAADWLSQSPAMKNAKRVMIQLSRVKKIHGQPCGVFEIQMLGSTKETTEPTRFCEGQVAVNVSTCRTVRTVCDARFAISEERGPAGATFTVSNRGTAHIDVQSRVRR